MMRGFLTTGLMVAALAVTAVAQDWYHDRDARYHGEEWRSHVFTNVRTDLEHIYSGAAADRERTRLVKTEEELTKLQGDLERGHFDNGILNDVIDSIRKSSNDDRLNERDREVLADDLVRLKDYQDHHNHWH